MAGKHPVQLVWLKRDLRLHDHEPLSEAVRRGPVLLLYVCEDAMIEAPDFSALHLGFIRESLAGLRRAVADRGGRLVIRRGDAVEVLEALNREIPIAALWSHQETGNLLTYDRDRRVARWCRERGIPWTECTQNGVIRRLRDRDGWANRWMDRMRRPVIDAPERIPSPADLSLEEGALPDPGAFGLEAHRGAPVQPGGEEAAHEVLDGFLNRRGVNYRKDMSSPVDGWEGCSRISPYLSWGCISMKCVYQAAQQRAWDVRDAMKSGEPVDKRWSGSLQSFLGRLRWHCHFMQKLEDEPEIEVSNFNRAYDGLREDEWNESRFEAWRRGETGYPMIDACMRCLAETGWINFRMRAMLVSFSSYHLWLHWKRPAEYLARVFLDYEPGIHYSQVQMQSGTTGINSVRIYSPIKQATDQDPEGVFIKRWVPELEAVPVRFLAEPHKLPELEQAMLGVRIGRDYPEPIVDHKTAYQTARSRIFQRKSSPGARRLADAVQHKHGSRRSGIPPVRRGGK